MAARLTGALAGLSLTRRAAGLAGGLVGAAAVAWVGLFVAAGPGSRRAPPCSACRSAASRRPRRRPHWSASCATRPARRSRCAPTTRRPRSAGPRRAVAGRGGHRRGRRGPAAGTRCTWSTRWPAATRWRRSRPWTGPRCGRPSAGWPRRSTGRRSRARSGSGGRKVTPVQPVEGLRLRRDRAVDALVTAYLGDVPARRSRASSCRRRWTARTSAEALARAAEEVATPATSADVTVTVEGARRSSRRATSPRR